MNANDDKLLGLVVLGSGLAAASALAWPVANRRSRSTGASDARVWLHPVPSIDDRVAVVSNPFRARTSDDSKATQHLGVDLMYRRRDSRDLVSAFPVGTSGGTALFFMPENVPVFAASAGIVTFATMTNVGNTVVVHHPNGWTTYYTHLASLNVAKGARVEAGQKLGTIGPSPADAAHLRHLHFELWSDVTRTTALDPAPYLAAWPRLRIVQSPETPLRNSSLSSYRPVGERGEPYPTWVRELRGESGVYVIREINGPIVYVGSSVGRLYETLTRHFQTWRRYKGFWRGQFAEGADPGLTYPRGDVEVAIKRTTSADAHDEELRMIRRLQPRDNQLGQPELQPELEEAPF